MAYSHLLSEGRIGSLRLRNRILLSAMGSNYSDADGRCNQRMLDYYKTHAKGGTGLLIMETSAADWPNGATTPNTPGFSSDRFIPELKELTAGVHQHGAAIAVQLNHGGKMAQGDVIDGRPVLVPSLPEKLESSLLSALTRKEKATFVQAAGPDGKGPRYKIAGRHEIERLIKSFAQAAARAKSANFDAVEIHAGHGYLLASFLSPFFNRRQDDYGGSVENRARFLCQVIAAVRAASGKGFPILVRLDAHEYGIDGGISIDAAVQHAQLAVAAGADAIDVSAYGSGLSSSAFTEAPLVHKPNGLLGFAKTIKRAVPVPVIAVGRISPQIADQSIARGMIDFVAMGRKLLADPALANKLATDPALVRPCIYCYLCVSKIFLNQPLACAVNPAIGREAKPGSIKQTDNPQKISIVGGGPAGLEAARLLALRGHRVSLYEKAGQLGGTARVAAMPYPPNGDLMEWLIYSVRQLPVEVHLNSNVTAELLVAQQPNHVILAVGAQRFAPDIIGKTLPHAFDGEELHGILLGHSKAATAKLPWMHRLVIAASRSLGLFNNTARLRLLSRLWLPFGKRIVIIGGGLIGLELAEYLTERRRQVTVLETSPYFGAELSLIRRARTLHALRMQGVQLINQASVTRICADCINYVERAGNRSVAADTVIIATGAANNMALAEQLKGQSFQVHSIGDGHKIGYIEGAMLGAYQLAAKL